MNNRRVLSFSKEYGGEEHEVFAPEEQATQVLISILTILNEGRPEAEQFVLARKGDIGSGDMANAGVEMMKETTVESVVGELYNDEMAAEVVAVLNGGLDE